MGVAKLTEMVHKFTRRIPALPDTVLRGREIAGTFGKGRAALGERDQGREPHGKGCLMVLL